ncbi:Cation/H+ exchanger [Thamnocephalis sphaerospora]|uniref:Cation/H+ exchanger n=1 Tax=Thamnocephalis sphaerospora TaxID=78915 RepID=A0A4P9XPF9_9FUNG|nr:Cation/H+ exchanger [Thamnocephalis sphaerospora]|eukprot:RKP07762.1 Cation/H+ exchanger [Thamnocephalis sphaerospora]
MVEFHADTVSLVSAVLGLFIVVFGLTSMPIKEWLYLSEALVATLFGIAIGPAALDLVNPADWGDSEVITLQFSRIIIAMSVMAAGVTLPKAYLFKEWRSLTVLLLPVMFFKWLASAAIIVWLLPVSFMEALMLAACITPTDPVLANSIAKGRFAEQHVPENVRNILSAESGANDGLGFPYLFFPILFLRRASHAEAIGEWFYSIWAYQILLSILIGAAVGYAARKLLYYAESRELIDKESFLVFSFALAMFIMGFVFIIGSDDLFAVFIAGNAFTWE